MIDRASLYLCIVLVSLPISLASAQPTSGKQPTDDRQQIVARLGEQPITRAEVDFQLGRTPAADGSMAELPESILLATIHMISQQRRSLETLKKSGGAVSPSEVDTWLEKNNPALEGQSGSAIAKSTAESAGIEESAFRNLLTWRISWQRYLAKHLTPDNMHKHFEKQLPRFNGTRFRIEHIYFPAMPGDSPERTLARQQLIELRQQVVSGDTKLDAGVKQLNQRDQSKHKSASAKLESLWASGTGPLHPAVMDSVIELQPMEMSKVFSTPVGEHLVRVLEVETGTKKLDEVTSDVRRHMLLYLLDYSARQSAAKFPLVVERAAVEIDL